MWALAREIVKKHRTREMIERPENRAKAATLNFWLKTLGERPDAIVSELALNKWKFRADLVVAGRSISAFEIKTKTDSLQRLTSQLEAYSSIFENVFAVLATNHLDKISNTLPPHVGLFEIFESKGLATVRCVREAKRSPEVNRVTLSTLLPMAELRRLLKSAGIKAPLSAKRDNLESFLLEISTEEIGETVRHFLAKRYDHATSNFLEKVSGRPIRAPDIHSLRIWPLKAPPGKNARSTPSDSIILPPSRTAGFAFGDVPSDLKRLLGLC